MFSRNAGRRAGFVFGSVWCLIFFLQPLVLYCFPCPIQLRDKAGAEVISEVISRIHHEKNDTLPWTPLASWIPASWIPASEAIGIEARGAIIVIVIFIVIVILRGQRRLTSWGSSRDPQGIGGGSVDKMGDPYEFTLRFYRGSTATN